MIRLVNKSHPEIELIRTLLPMLCCSLELRLNTKGQLTRSYAELYSIAEDAARGVQEHFVMITAGPCIVGVNTIKPWWSDDTILMEEFIIRYKPGDFADTIKELEQMAKDLGCKSLAIGSLAMIRQESYGEYLKRKGFREVARQYTKGVT